ncbi:MAG: hypothetical protein M1820_000718 [Bogoriella megaspora]|nr:MAG: hypothetical protein M1820_000718 [Bogoriella megaspora]
MSSRISSQQSSSTRMNSVSVVTALVAFVLAAVSQARSGQIPLGHHDPSVGIKLESIPLLGFGTWNLKISEQNTHIDCAKIYGNQKEVGKGIHDGLKRGGVKRSEVWITSKLWNDRHDPDQVEKGLDDTLYELNLQYLDLYLMHWPVASDGGMTYESYIKTWKAMTNLLSTGKTRHIGISNFSPHQLKELLKSSPHRPSVHQMEMHPYLPQTDWLNFHDDNDIHVTAYSPLGNANPTYKDKKASSPDSIPPLLENPEVEEIAERRNCTTAQVALKWGIGRKTSVIPKSSHLSRIQENFGAQQCRLEDEDLKLLGRVGRKYLHRFNNPSKSYGVPLFQDLEDA